MKNKYIVKDLFILTNKLKRLLDNKHSENGIYLGQARLLTYLYFNKDDKVYQKDIENAFQIRGGTVTGMIDSLVNSGHINRVESETDKRKRKIILTPKGELSALRAIDTINEFEKNLSSIITKEEKELLDSVILKINDWIDVEERK